jgi:hypothetical protein
VEETWKVKALTNTIFFGDCTKQQSINLGDDEKEEQGETYYLSNVQKQ